MEFVVIFRTCHKDLKVRHEGVPYQFLHSGPSIDMARRVAEAARGRPERPMEINDARDTLRKTQALGPDVRGSSSRQDCNGSESTAPNISRIISGGAPHDASLHFLD